MFCGSKYRTSQGGTGCLGCLGPRDQNQVGSPKKKRCQWKELKNRWPPLQVKDHLKSPVDFLIANQTKIMVDYSENFGLLTCGCFGYLSRKPGKPPYEQDVASSKSRKNCKINQWLTEQYGLWSFGYVKCLWLVGQMIVPYSNPNCHRLVCFRMGGKKKGN